MISPFARSVWPRPVCPPGTPVGAKKANPICCIIGDSKQFGTGTPSGNASRRYLDLMLLASGINVTWKGNQTSGNYARTEKTQCIVAATLADHLASGSINTPQYFGVGNPLHPCDTFLVVTGSNDGDGGPGTPNVVNYGANLNTLWSELVAKEPGCTFGTAYIERGGSVLRNSGIDDINATQIAAGIATIQGAGGLATTGDNRVLPQAQAISGLGGQGSLYLGTESPDWVHDADAGCLIVACQLLPLMQNLCGYAAQWPGDAVS